MAWQYIITSQSGSVSGWGAHFNDRAKINGQLFYDYFHDKGFTDASIFGMMGNIEHESYFNPGQMEIGHNASNYYGHGLIQWTGDIQHQTYVSPLLTYAQQYNRDWWDGDFQCYVINEIDPNGSWIPTQTYPQTWAQYKQITDIETAVKCYYRNRERGGSGQEHFDLRISYAEQWKDIIEHSPTPPTPSDDNELLAMAKHNIRFRRSLFNY